MLTTAPGARWRLTKKRQCKQDTGQSASSDCWAEQTRVSRLLSTTLAVYELQAQQERDRHLAFDGEITD